MRPFVLALPALLLALAACEKAPTPRPDDTPPVKSAEPTVAPATASAAMTVGPVDSAPTPTLAAASASAEPPAKPADKPTTGAAAAPKAASAHVTGKNYALDVAAPACKSGTDCAMTIKLVPGGEFHVNKEYPYKFVATPHAGVTFLGKPDANQFTKAGGDFVEQGEKAATMTVRFKPTAGEQRIGGTFKLSVCSADQCQIEQAQVDLPVTVL